MAPEDLEIIDAHHHLWDLGRNYYPWLADHPEPNFLLGDYAPLKRNYLAADYRRDAVGLKVLATVHVEAEHDRNRQVAETEWLHEIGARDGLPNAIVAHAWLHTDDCEEILARQKSFPLVRGIRSKPVTAGSPGETPPTGPGSMHDPKWRRGLAALEKYDLSWDLRVPFWHLAEAAEVCARIPGVRVALNHTGLPWDRSDAGLAHWRAGMQALAACPNVHCKVSELGLKNAPWTIDGNRRVVREAIEIFGIGRCMFASNFPVAGLRIGYRAQIAALLEILADLGRSEIDQLFRDNARRFYRIG